MVESLAALVAIVTVVVLCTPPGTRLDLDSQWFRVRFKRDHGKPPRKSVPRPWQLPAERDRDANRVVGRLPGENGEKQPGT